MAPPTRLRILDYIRKHQTTSVNELSSILEMTGANVRHHLAILESTDLIEIISQRQERRWRPVNVYGLSRRLLGDGLDVLAIAMFEGLVREVPETLQEDLLVSIAIHIGGTDIPDRDTPLPRRLTLAVDRLNELHYQARWEAGVDGARIILGHCPYAAIIATTPELCRMDENLLVQRCGSAVEQMAKLQRSANSYPFCLFRVIGNR